MGTRNRQRRAEKHRRRQQASAPRSERRFHEFPARQAIYAAVGALHELSPERYGEMAEALADGPARVAVELEAVVGEALRAAWAGNWDAGEVTRQTERRLGARQARYVADLAGRTAGTSGWWDPAQPHLGQWAAKERIARVEAMACAIEVLALVLHLPPLPKLGAAGAPGPARRPPRSGQDQRILEKIRALLAKAESTTFPEEAEALSAKAQELMARHSIDSAIIGAAQGADDAPTGIRLPVDDPYAGAKSMLLSEVASANRCRAVWSKGLGISSVLGFESDLEFVELLYTSLLVQATSAMVAAGSQVDRHGRSRTRSFRHSFLLAYAFRIGDRLRAAERVSRLAATEEYGAALLPVLADRSDAVDAARDAAFPGAVSRSVSSTNAAGSAAGRAAADLASLSGRIEVAAKLG